MSRAPVVLFESWRGRYADSPRAISERLGERVPDLRRVWVTAPGTVLPEGVGAVVRHGPAHLALLCRADLVVTNDLVTRWPRKARRTRYLQTWHGTPLKALGHDEPAPTYPGAAAHRARLERDVARWDALVSAGPECSRLFRSAFRFPGPLLETGSPRNDVLHGPTAAATRRRVREAFGVRPGERVVLHVPTWRDGDVGGGATGGAAPAALDVAGFVRRAAEDWVLWTRAHSVVRRDGSHGREAGHGPRVRDVSAHPEVAELYLAADVLVSDYSSAVYDVAPTGLPIVLLAPDLDDYRRGRPLYFDYHDWAPGPVVGGTDDLVEVLEALPAGGPGWSDPWADLRRGFAARFAPHDDGGAADRVIDGFVLPALDGVAGRRADAVR